MTSFRVTPTELNHSATDIDRLAADTAALAVQLEGECEAPPKVGNVQATAVYQQAHYDWTQTRFEDLMAAEAHLAVFARNLRETVGVYARCDADAARLLYQVLHQLDTPADGTGH